MPCNGASLGGLESAESTDYGLDNGAVPPGVYDASSSDVREWCSPSSSGGRSVA